ncbi:amino acid/polyamine/organocation transporter (APC superfamily) [Isoptericola sp. CG 20/1183]|uniref:Amino acid/polyamine/organocation transporter (APC superfamily) n=1 Tax=Isoptericola halotolerans TaxID=300560 RepID=A0ABX5EAJ1_9MICO|nr:MULTISPECIES: APC family permease [Isoptericola]MCK0115629.1 APC family permease [Isoptericola sp. S6320L]PRZ03833.1 amino acid/polyamine/organocation transporter (APC superfamily) [Isoptericola sp. CG 20/1183]PRZ04034.1 amino acid/polyamine/organocation transporter (APC superfamily) [Isoptericola halotolerans]
MSDIADAAKRLLVGRPLRSESSKRSLLPKRVALPVFASDALSSMAYAPDEILLMLAVAGIAATAFAPWVGAVVVVVLLVVVASYRQIVRAYPSGGGDYEVATTNLGPTAGIGVASALMLDYVLTVAVSLSAASQYLVVLLPAARGYEPLVAVVLVAALTVVNLRGVRESAWVFVVVIYCFMAALGILAVVGAVAFFSGEMPQAASADLELVPAAGFEQGLLGVAGAFLVARAFASGAVALTGVESITSDVPAFQRPKRRNAATTLALLGAISAVMLMTILFLAQATGVKFVEDPATQLTRDGAPVGDEYEQHPVLAQLAETVFGGFSAVAAVVIGVTALVLLLAANTAFHGFPVLGSLLAKDGYLPRQLHTRGDRMAFSNGIVTLAVAAGVLVVAFDAEVTALIQLYIVGVFVSFTLAQLGMLRHWTRELRKEPNPKVRGRMKWSRVLNGTGFVLTSAVLVIVLVTKFTHGAWITVVAMGVLFLIMRGIHRHYMRVRSELALDDISGARALPSRVHAVVLVSRVHKPTMRALAYARASRPSMLEAVTVGVDQDEITDLRRQWEALDLPVPLRVLDSPYREITRPVLHYVRSLRSESPRDLVVVYIPEYVVGHWWEHLLHNQSALRLKGRLLFTPGVVVASVPWQLSSSAGYTGLEGDEVEGRRPL